MPSVLSELQGSVEAHQSFKRNFWLSVLYSRTMLTETQLGFLAWLSSPDQHASYPVPWRLDIIDVHREVK